MDASIGTLILEMVMLRLSKNPCPFNRVWLDPCVDEGYAMLYPVSCGYIAGHHGLLSSALSRSGSGPVPNRAQAPRARSSLVSPMATSSSSNFQSNFDAALQSYNNKTKNKLLDHPLAARLQSCNSPNAIFSVLQDLIQQFDQRRTSDERLENWLSPTVNVLYTFFATLGGGVGLVSLTSLFLRNMFSDCYLLDILSRKCDICWYRCPSLGECPYRSLTIRHRDTSTP
jgi:hypothetical protein